MGRNVLSFDLEHWYTATLVAESVSNPDDHICESTRLVLSLCDRHDVTATFFVVGEVADEYPDLVAEVADAGHEIASHGHTHTPLFDLTPEECKTELLASADAIEAAVGERPRGFRAPNFSVTHESEWAFSALEDLDYDYDSSVFPIKTPMYGVNRCPVRPYTPSRADPFSAADGIPSYDLCEIPMAVFHPIVRFPMAGGFYARALPFWVLKRGITTLNNRGINAILYFHPWEFNPAVVRDDLSFAKRFVSFHNVEGLKSKLDRLLAQFEFGAIRDVVL